MSVDLNGSTFVLCTKKCVGWEQLHKSLLVHQFSRRKREKALLSPLQSTRENRKPFSAWTVGRETCFPNASAWAQCLHNWPIRPCPSPRQRPPRKHPPRRGRMGPAGKLFICTLGVGAANITVSSRQIVHVGFRSLTWFSLFSNFPFLFSFLPVRMEKSGKTSNVLPVSCCPFF